MGLGNCFRRWAAVLSSLSRVNCTLQATPAGDSLFVIRSGWYLLKRIEYWTRSHPILLRGIMVIFSIDAITTQKIAVLSRRTKQPDLTWSLLPAPVNFGVVSHQHSKLFQKACLFPKTSYRRWSPPVTRTWFSFLHCAMSSIVNSSSILGLAQRRYCSDSGL